MAAPQRRSDCPINFGLELFGDKWTLLVVRDMMFKGKHGYGAFLESGEHIATNILADRLHQLEVAGLIVKRVDPARKSRFIYALAERGIDLLPVMVEIILWSAQHDPLTAATPEFVAAAHADRAGLIAGIRMQLETKLDEVRALP